MSENNYPPGVSELPGDNIKLIKHNYEVYGGFSTEVYENENKDDYLKDNIKDILYNAYKDGSLGIIEY